MSNTRPTETHNVAKPTSDRQQLVPPFPPQHQDRPGSGAEMTPAARFEAPGCVSGDSGTGRATAVLLASSVPLLDYAATKGPIHAFTKSLAHGEVISLLGGETSAA